MKHWDLKPGEIVTLKRGADDQSPDLGNGAGEYVRARFLFHTTRKACFETILLDPNAPPVMLEFEALDHGGLAEVDRGSFVRRLWHVVGRDRDTRFVACEPLGQRKTYTMTARSVQRAIARGTGV